MDPRTRATSTPAPPFPGARLRGAHNPAAGAPPPSQRLAVAAAVYVRARPPSRHHNPHGNLISVKASGYMLIIGLAANGGCTVARSNATNRSTARFDALHPRAEPRA